MSRETLVMPSDTPKVLLDITRVALILLSFLGDSDAVFFQRCWQWEPAQRPTMSDICQAMANNTDANGCDFAVGLLSARSIDARRTSAPIVQATSGALRGSSNTVDSG